MRSLILIAGGIGSNYRNGGMAWVFLSWVLGFRRLGFDVVLLDQLDRARCVAPKGGDGGYEGCLNIQYFERIAREFSLRGALLGEHGESLCGPSYGEVLELAEASELLVNIAGNLRLGPVKRRVPLKVFLDIDPGFTQLWLASGEHAPRIEGHNLYFTIGENVGTAASPLPTGGVEWLHTRQPVVLDEWPPSDGGNPDRFTTVSALRGVGPHRPLDEIGLRYGQKLDEFARLGELPRHVPQEFELALDAPGGRDAAYLASHGWRLADAAAVAGDPGDFRRYVQTSGGEFSVAKSVYVEASTGWFSDRTTRYLASGKPALVQDTGFGRAIPVGEGLLAFRSAEDAVGAATDIASEYERHRVAARRIAEEYFESDKVLGRFLEDAEAAR